MQVLPALLKQQHEEFSEAWSKLFFNLQAVRQLATEVKDADTAATLLAAGSAWDGHGWTTTKAFKKVLEVTGTSMVRSEFDEYRHTFLFALSLLFDVEVPQLELSAEAGEAAYAFCRQVCGPDNEDTTMEEDESPPKVTLEWDEPIVQLPPDLLAIWKGALDGERKLDLPLVLQRVPKYDGVPARAPENNHRGDAKSPLDKQLRNYQNTVLHLVRLLGTAYSGGPNARVQFQQAWQLLGEVYLKLGNHRKELSIPGSVGPAGPTLFGKEEIQQAALRSRVNLAGKQPMKFYPGPKRFRPPPKFGYGFRGFGFQQQAFPVRYVQPVGRGKGSPAYSKSFRFCR